MRRIKGLYARDDRMMVPVYELETDGPEGDALGGELERGEAQVIREYVQLGFEQDISIEIIQRGRQRIAVMTVTPGGYIGRMKKQAKRAQTKAIKAGKGNG